MLIEVNSAKRKQAQDIVKFVNGFIGDLGADGRLVLAAELVKLLRPEIDELSRRAREAKANEVNIQKC